MSKAVKKKVRRLKRTVRKTLGTLFLVSALVVAAIPVDGLQASNDDNGIMTLAEDRNEDYSQDAVKVACTVPSIPSDAYVYTTEDKKLSFVYFQANEGWVVILTGFAGGYVEGETLNIPNAVDAYRQYSSNDGQGNGYVAVGRAGNFLFYRKSQNYTYRVTAEEFDTKYKNNSSQVMTDKGTIPTNKYVGLVSVVPIKGDETDEDKITHYDITLEEETGYYIQCQLDTDKDYWEKLDDSRIYYYSKYYNDASVTDEIPTSRAPEAGKDFTTVDGNQTYQRIKGVQVNYISKQKKSGQEWVNIDKPEDGVFAGTSNIASLSLGEEFRGVGDYAFYGSGIQSIKFYNGLESIGTGAFMNCIQLREIELSSNCPLKTVGVSAFENCRSMTEFSMPWSVVTIGNSAFQGCDALQKIDLCNEGDSTSGSAGVNMLQNVGFDVFKNCSALQALTFPDTCAGPVYMSTFAGCSSLRYICSRNMNMTFPEDSLLTYNQFKSMLGVGTRVNGEFYFEGREDSALHKMCKENCFAFSYIGDRNDGFKKLDYYELTMEAEEGNNGTNTFVVRSTQNLCRYNGTTDVVKTITIPKKIGPYNIHTLDEGVIRDWCNLETVVIPNTITAIGDRAFQGCHNLTNVIFDNYNLASGDNVTIGQKAFETQNCTSHKLSGCEGVLKDDDGSPKEKLNFIGPVSLDFAPYQYAMSDAGTYNNNSQTTSYITYFTGWPGNLEIQYNPQTGLSELVNYSNLEELSSYAVDTKSPVYKYLKFMGDDYVEAVRNAYSAYTSGNMTPLQSAAVNSIINLVIPEGVQSVKEGLIYSKNENNLNPTKTVTAYSLVKIASGKEVRDGNGKVIKIEEGTGTFANCKDLTGIYLNAASDGSGTTTIESHAFMGCDKLVDVSLSPTVTTMGISPFYGCENLSTVNFQNNPNFVCEKSIIYGLDGGGNKVKILECLGGRSSRYVDKDEVAGIQELAEEAFRGSHVASVDLTGTSIATVPVRAFAETTDLSRVSLPNTLTGLAFQDYAFEGSTVDYFVVESVSSTMRASNNAFIGLMKDANTPRPESENGDVQWYSVGEQAEAIGEAWGFTPKVLDGVIVYYSVTFTYWDNETQDYVIVDAEEKIPSNNMSSLEEMYPVEVGSVAEMGNLKYRLTEWKENVDARKSDHLYYEASYSVLRWIVTFQNYNGAVITTIEVADEGSIPEQKRPVVGVDFEIPEGRTFKGWLVDGDLGYITSDLTAVADISKEGEYDVEYLARKGSITSPWESFYILTLKEGDMAPNLIPPLDEWAVAGYKFTGWDKDLSNISEDTKLYATYEPQPGNGIDPDVPYGYYTLNVVGGTGSGIYPAGAQVVISANDPAEGQVFSDWSVSPVETTISDRTRATTIITMPNADVAVVANYRSDNGSGSGNNPGDDNPGGDNPGGDNPGGDNPGGDDPGNNGDDTVKRYTLTVKGGSGSGEYAAGEQIIVTADAPLRGQEFSSWTVSPASTVVTDKNLTSIAITMPEYDVAVIANYKASNSSSTGTGSSNSANSNRPSGNAGTLSNGTTVVIDKNGLSNTGVVSATVNGSSDSFVIKVTESASATEAVLKALQAEYGDNLINVKYFPMDISLYDSTGTRKITDTTGLSISITLPLPDSLIAYAGNNKVAGVVNGRLDKLSPRFTTINNVACVTFTAEHFSPYVIYVDVTQLSDGTISDNTPKTGDWIHPKWFLSIGLACLSLIMFMMKDNRKAPRKKQRAAV